MITRRRNLSFASVSLAKFTTNFGKSHKETKVNCIKFNSVARKQLSSDGQNFVVVLNDDDGDAVIEYKP